MSIARNNKDNKRPITISPDDIEHHPWLFDFFNSTAVLYQSYWEKDRLYSYSGNTFKLSRAVLARKRHNNNSLAFEVIDKSRAIGTGGFGDVFRIHATISKDKDRKIQARDKSRVVKHQHEYCSIVEFGMGKRTDHLHIKEPTRGYLVMRKMPGETLFSLLYKHRLTRQEKWDLTLAIAEAVKHQLADKQLHHTDLHRSNVMVAVDRNTKKFIVNIIDYGCAEFDPSINSHQFSPDFDYLLSFSFKLIWRNEPYLPNSALLSLKAVSLESIIQSFKAHAISPVPSAQAQLDDYFDWISSVSTIDDAIASYLLDQMQTAARKSTTAMQAAILAAQDIYANNCNRLPPLPHILIGTDENQQIILNQISAYFDHLAFKAKDLKSDPATQASGETLSKLVKQLRQSTFDACYSSANQQASFENCRSQCADMITLNKNLLRINRNKNYILAEIGAVLLCLVVLYPFAAAIHYAATRRFTFFGETASESKVRKAERALCSLSQAAHTPRQLRVGTN